MQIEYVNGRPIRTQQVIYDGTPLKCRVADCGTVVSFRLTMPRGGLFTRPHEMFTCADHRDEGKEVLVVVRSAGAASTGPVGGSRAL